MTPLRNHFAILPAIILAPLLLLAVVLLVVRPAFAQTITTPTCANETSVANPGLVSDCETLLESQEVPTSTVPTAHSGVNDDEAQPGSLFSEIEGDPPPSHDVETLASRLVGIDFGQLDQVTDPSIEPKDPASGKPTTQQTLVLNLFDDVVFTGIVEHVEPTASGHALWGSLEGVELGTMTMVVNGSVVVGTVRTPSEVYTIRTAGDGKYVIRQIDESSLPPPAEPLEAPPSSPGVRPKTDDGADQPDDGSVIDVMVVYTPLVTRREGGRGAVEALIDLFVAETNQAYANSGVIHRIRLVLREELDYVEDGDSHLDLHRLRDDSDGYMDDVHELRDLYAADLVHIVVGRSVNVCGVASLNRGETAAADERFGFGLTAYYCGGLTFAHELGHNMGLGHDRYELGRPRYSSTVIPVTGSHYGYVNQRMFEPGAPESSYWRTIMAYGRQCGAAGLWCPRIQYFSNPEVTYNGDPMGVPADNPSTGVDGPADAVGSLNERRQITANFRRSSASPSPRVGLTLSPYWLAEIGGISRVTATLHRPSDADTTVRVSASPADAVRLSASRTLTIPAGRAVSDGAVTITGVDNGDQTGDVSVTISATVENPSSLGVIAPEPVELAIDDDETTPVVTLSLSRAEIVELDEWTTVTATLDNRSGADTTVTLSATPADAVGGKYSTLTIPAGQRANVGYGVEIYPLNDEELTEARRSVTISGTATNSQGVTGPESVTLTIIDDEAPIFADDSVAYTFTEGVAASRVLPEAGYGNGTLTYSLSPAPSNGVTFTPGPPARIGISTTSVAADETSYTLTATDADGDTDTMTISITIRKGLCPNSAAVSGYSDPGIVPDCEALLASKDVLRGDQSLNWSEDLSMGEWQGVELADGRVVGIDVFNLGLTGTIAGELGRIVNLRTLQFNSNELTGGIPLELGNLSNLRYLGLSGNEFTGEIPSELGNLSNLRTLSLGHNQLTGSIPKELGNLYKLQSLTLSSNDLTGGIPTELGNLSNLRTLSLGHNQLTGSIPKELGNLSKLETLWLLFNRLTGEIPSELGNLSRLRSLHIRGGNQFTGCVPDRLRDVTGNDFLFLDLPYCSELACVNEGAVPDGTNEGLVSDCGALLMVRDAGTATLNWSADTPIADWSGVVVDGVPGRVTELQLGGLGLNGGIPKELGSLDGLRTLDLRDNQLTGGIPTELESLPDLQNLNLSDNQLTGGIPAELGNLSNLQSLYLGGNRLTLCVPDGLRDVPNNDLTMLDLPYCSQHACVSGGAGVDAINTGLISDCVTLLAMRDTLAGTATLNWSTDTPIADWSGVVTSGNKRRVTELSPSGQGLTGEIPKELSRLTNLQRLFLSNNQLTGEIPTELGNLYKLEWLYIIGNRLTGEIPVELGNLTLLITLRLDDNHLMGEIPAELGNLYNLQWLTLADNQLIGDVPFELANLHRLTLLELADNQLTGCVPAVLRLVPNNDFERLGLPFCPLSPPEAVIVGFVKSEMNSLAISWAPPLSEGGSYLIAYDLRYIETSADETVDSNWTVVEDVWAAGSGALEYTLTGLTGGTQYDVQVRAVNGEGDGPWSETVTGTPTSSVCVTGGAVTDATNTGLISDCEALLEAHDTLAGTGSLNWSANVPIDQWDGVKLGGTPNRLTRIVLHNKGLNGTVPESLGRFSGLTDLNLSNNELTGPIPAELGDLYNLRVLNLRTNELTGAIPDELGNLRNLRVLNLHSNSLSGAIPDLSGLIDLEELYLPNNADDDADGNKVPGTGLTGEIPTWLNGMTKLRELWLWGNSLTGAVPDLSGMTSLDKLKLANNNLTGGIPEASTLPPNMTWLIIDRNPFGGTIPDMSALSRLRLLWLHSSELTGSVPAGDMLPVSLDDLNLRDNMLMGEIPDLSNLDNLTRLRLHNNSLSGEVPATLGGLDSLKYLWLHNEDATKTDKGNNAFTSIAAGVGDLADTLIVIALSGNPWDANACVPSELANVTRNDYAEAGISVCSAGDGNGNGN